MIASFDTASRSVDEKSSSVRALTRGLAILRYVNLVHEAGPTQIATALNIPRPTVYRLVETLIEQGYLISGSSSNRVRVTRITSQLGDSYNASSEICQVAGPILSKFAPRIIWPICLSVYRNGYMVVQETTHARSPLSIDNGMTGYKLPMLRTAAGRCFLGHCEPDTRRLILETVASNGDAADGPYLEERHVTQMLATVRERGYAMSSDGEFRNETAAIAVPIISEGTLVASLAFIWIRHAISAQEATKKNIEILREVANSIAIEL